MCRNKLYYYINYNIYMFYRRKILLAILESFNNDISNIDFQKYLFLFTKLQEKANAVPSYHFVPYQYGCFSFQSYYDKNTMVKYGLLEDHKNWRKKDNHQYFNDLTLTDKKLLNTLNEKYGSLKGDTLVKFVYQEYPYYAINSKIANRLMSTDELKDINKLKPRASDTKLFTIGYEGLSIEEYANKLIKNNIKLLVDVRRNPISMKRGFSKGDLTKVLEKLNINYIHVPSLGIASAKRKTLNSFEDYKKLFKEYTIENLSNNSNDLDLLKSLLTKYKRIALTCFEKDHEYCHRGAIIKFIQARPDWNFQVENL